MRRFWLHAVPLAAILSITACGSAPAQTGKPASAAEVATEVIPAATTAATGGPPVTAMMSELGLAGEPYAAIGDPNAPLTVVEFSDYG